MIKLLSYPFSVLFYLCFGIVLVIFHVIQIITFNVFGYNAHKTSVDVLNLFIIRCLNILRTRIHFDNPYQLKKNKAYIIVSNHQSMYDIPPIIWYMRKIHPKFISKKELGKGIPSVSYNLRKGGSVLIDRKDSTQAVNAIKSFGNYLETNHRTGVIFPEGTRSRDGKLKPFKEAGLRTLIEHCPNAEIIPISIKNSWKLQRYGMFPLPIATKIEFKVHKPISANNYTFENIMDYCLKEISESLYHRHHI